MKASRFAPVIAAICGAFLLVGSAFATSDAPTVPLPTYYLDSGSFTTAYTLITRYKSLASQTIQKVGILREGLNDTQGVTMHIWMPGSGASATLSPTLSGTSVLGVQWADVSASSLTLATNDTFYVGVDQAVGYHSPYWIGLAANQTFGNLQLLSSAYHTGWSTDLTSGSWPSSSQWYNMLVEAN